jgi:hypothetical protein
MMPILRIWGNLVYTFAHLFSQVNTGIAEKALTVKRADGLPKAAHQLRWL